MRVAAPAQLLGAAALVVFAVGPMTPRSQAQNAPAPTQQVQMATPEEAREIARWAYDYAYPIVIMDVTMRQATNVPNAATTPMRAPVDQFAHVRAFPSGDAKDVVRINFDTLYSSAFVDVSREPMVLEVPDTGGRYYLLPMLDMWTDVFAMVGKRTTGTKAGTYALVGPGWTGALPAGMEKIVAPTPMIWIIGRTQTNGPADYDAVHKIQDGYKLRPLSGAAPATATTDPSIDEKTPPMVQVNAMSGMAMLQRLATLMAKYPPHANDDPILMSLKRIGFEPGRDFDPARLDPATAQAIEAGLRDAVADLQGGLTSIGRQVNGWQVITENTGTYGTSYRQRAEIALGGLGANLPEDAIYPTAFRDADGQPLTGANRYVLHFDKDKLPPADAFWSVTMYGPDNYQVPNPINRFALGDRDRLARGPDGGIDIYLANASPGGDKEQNWLPAPTGAFNVTLRLYSPKRAVLDGSWVPPGIKRSAEAAGSSAPPLQ